MAQAGVRLQRETLSCSICLDPLKDPVTLTCGHSFCMNCVKDHWDTEEVKSTYSCPQCREAFRPRPKLKKNVMLSELVGELKKTELHAAPAPHCYAGAEDVACDVCTGRKLKALKSCLVCLASYCEEHLQPHHQSAAFKKHKLVEPSKNLQENICPRHDDPDTGLAAAEKKQKQQQQLRGQLQHVLTETETLSEADVLLTEPEPKTRAELFRYSQAIGLDPNTANNYLFLSEANRKVTVMKVNQCYPRHTDRFTYLWQVLSKESLSGRCYWEVEWTGRGGVCVAVMYKNISRSGCSDECLFGCNDKSWALGCYQTSCKFVHNSIETKVSDVKVSRVGVYLDHRAGLLSFYRVFDTMTLIHRVHTTFTQPLYAGVRLYSSYLSPADTAEFCKLI